MVRARALDAVAIAGSALPAVAYYAGPHGYGWHVLACVAAIACYYVYVRYGVRH